MPEFLVENENEIIRNVHHPDMFIADSFEVVPFGMNVTLIVGKPKDPKLIQQLINPEKLMVQSVKFLKPDWDLSMALEWLKENQKDFSTYKESKNFKADLKSIKGVEIFSAGTWNGDKFTTKDLDEMVRAFRDTGKTSRPYLKLGHNEEQKLAKTARPDGEPAIGWIGNLYRKGEKLVADFIDIPSKIFELLENKSYRNVSSEIFFDIKVNGQDYGMMLKACSLLGADTPAVSNLADIMARFGLKDYASIKTFAENEKEVTIKTYSNKNETKINKKDLNMPKSENEIALEIKLKAAEDKNKNLEADNKKFSTDLETSKTDLEKSEADRVEAQKKAFAADEKSKATEIEKQVDTLVNEKLISTAMKPFAMALLTNKVDEKTKKFSFKSGDEDKNLDRFELIKEFASLAQSTSEVNFDDNSIEGDKKAEALLEKSIEKYSLDNKVSYADAYIAVTKDKLKVGEA